MRINEKEDKRFKKALLSCNFKRLSYQKETIAFVTMTLITSLIYHYQQAQLSSHR